MPEPSSDWTIGRLVEWTRDFFQKKGIPQPRLDITTIGKADGDR
jgi:hypothetical protein